MLRQSPGRNQRSKGIKVKHVLQVCFLIAICFWLIYQVKHSHDKKKEFDENDAEISVSSTRTQIRDEVPKLGRKDLQPKVEETTTTGKNQDEEEAAAAEEEESIGEGENKHDEEQHQEEEQKFEDKEDEGKGVGEDELDEREQEKNDAEVDREEDVTEEEKGKEEGDEKENEESDSGDTNGRLESESSLGDHDEDDETGNSTHEAREEHYKADDASSAVVTHETQVTADENENQDPENLNKSGDESSDHEANVGENTNDSKIEEQEMIEKNPPINTAANEAVHDVASKSKDSSLSSNSSSLDQSNDHPTLDKNAEEVISEADGSSTQNVAREGTTFGYGSKLPNVSLDQADRSSLDGSSHEGENKLATSEKTGETYSSSEETSKPRNSSLPTMSDKSMDSSVVTEDGSESSATSEKLDNDDGTDVKESDASKTENQVEVQNDPIDSSDSSVAVRTDLDTLPEIQNEANNNEDAAAE